MCHRWWRRHLLDVFTLSILVSGLRIISCNFCYDKKKNKLKKKSKAIGNVALGCFMRIAARLNWQTENKKQACSIKPTVGAITTSLNRSTRQVSFYYFFLLVLIFFLINTRLQSNERKWKKLQKKKTNEMSNETSCKPNVLFKCVAEATEEKKKKAP